MKTAPDVAHVADPVRWDGRPALPRSACRNHEPQGYWHKMIERGLARRADVPCPECYLSQPGILSKNYVKLLQRPRADLGTGGMGLKIQIDMRQRIEYEARPVGSLGCLAWHMLPDVTVRK